MDIETARYTEGNQSVIVNDKLAVPVDEDNRHWQAVLEWQSEGGVIEPYQEPPPPADEERVDAAFPQTDSARVIFEAFFEISNRLRALEGKSSITRQQLKGWLKDKLP